ncbi:galectin-4-like [Helicoverpa zea]|uniref:galectin-4-like n=1 Tax=Helicoverpa zea TaxID=7113 RepID=UPI001F5A642D|nr:galectin-4-like [Helicoverpa zea]
MAAPPIYNPVIPCVHPIPAGMYPGRMIRVQGSIPPGAQRFAINFQCGPNTDPRDDIALHLNFRFVEMVVVRNHLTAMNWGVEDTNGGMPLHRGESFEALILCEPMSMKVALNGMHFCEFPHRIPFQRISHLTVDGDVMIQLIGFEGAQPPQQMYMSEPPAYGAYGAPPAYGAPGYGGAPQAPPAYGSPTAVPYGPQGPMMAGQQVMQAQPMLQGQQRRGMGTGAAVGMGAAALAAGGLAGYAMGGGFQGGSSNVEEVSTFSESVDFGGDDWMD